MHFSRWRGEINVGSREKEKAILQGEKKKVD